MLGLRTHHQSVKTLSTAQTDRINLPNHFSQSMVKALRKFWQFSCFYGDYVSRPLEQRHQRSISSEDLNC